MDMRIQLDSEHSLSLLTPNLCKVFNKQQCHIDSISNISDIRSDSFTLLYINRLEKLNKEKKGFIGLL